MTVPRRIAEVRVEGNATHSTLRPSPSSFPFSTCNRLKIPHNLPQFGALLGVGRVRLGFGLSGAQKVSLQSFVSRFILLPFFWGCMQNAAAAAAAAATAARQRPRHV